MRVRSEASLAVLALAMGVIPVLLSAESKTRVKPTYKRAVMILDPSELGGPNPAYPADLSPFWCRG